MCDLPDLIFGNGMTWAGDHLLIADSLQGHVLATHTHNSVLRLDPDGQREDIAGHAQGIAGSTSVAFGPHDPATLYVTTTGGILSPPGGKPEPARLIRLKP